MKPQRTSAYHRFSLWITGLLLLLLLPSAVIAMTNIVLDGQFGDWNGQAAVSDPEGDAQNKHTDLQTFYFGNNPNDETIYFMVERWEAGAQPLALKLYIDTNNNGNYGETADRTLYIDYKPRPGASQVTVDLYDGSGAFLTQVANNVNWGEPQPGRRVEWGISFADLGIVANQTIRMRLESIQGNSTSDGVAEVQWSPANALGLPLLILSTVAAVIWLAHQKKRLKWQPGS